MSQSRDSCRHRSARALQFCASENKSEESAWCSSGGLAILRSCADRDAAAMSYSAEALYKISDVELLTAYAEARRQFVEKKFARDTQRARLAWIRAKMFSSSSGGVTERNMALEKKEKKTK